MVDGLAVGGCMPVSLAIANLRLAERDAVFGQKLERASCEPGACFALASSTNAATWISAASTRSSASTGRNSYSIASLR